MNRHLGREISVYLTAEGSNFIRPSGAISQTAKENALEKIKTAFEGEKLFKDEHMKNMTQLNVRYVFELIQKIKLKSLRWIFVEMWFYLVSSALWTLWILWTYGSGETDRKQQHDPLQHE